MRSILRATLIGGSALATLGFAAAASAGTVRITVAEYSSKTGPYFAEVETAFEAEHPGTDIQFEVVPWDVLLQKLTTDIAGNANADLAIIGTRWLIEFVAQGVAAPLNSYMDQAFRDRFIETFLSPSILDGQTYGLPIAASARAMYWNKALFEQAGLAGPPATWDELVAAAQAIDGLADDVAGYGMQGKEIETDVYYYYALWSFGGDILEADGTSGLDTPEALAAAELYKRLIDEGLTEEGVTAYNREDVQNLFKQGRVGMMITAPFLASQIKAEVPDLQYGIAPIPSAGAQGTYGVTDSIILFENSQVKDEAWAFLEFIFRTDWRTKFDQNEGFLPVNAEEAGLPYFAESEDLQAFAAVLPNARFAPVIEGWEEIADITSRALQRIYLGEQPAADALKAAAEEIDGVLGK